MSTPAKPTKKQRALPRVWARFFSLKSSDTFTYQGKRYYKSVFPCFAVHLAPGTVTYEVFPPWTRVQTDVLVRDARPGGKSGPPDGYGVRGPSGPGFKNAAEEDAHWESAGSTTPEQNEAREFPTQPNSDNNITGPTS